MDVSKNRGFPPKSSILIGFSIINQPFWGTHIFGNTQMYPNVLRICKTYVSTQSHQHAQQKQHNRPGNSRESYTRIPKICVKESEMPNHHCISIPQNFKKWSKCSFFETHHTVRPNNGLSRLPTNHLSKCSANHPRCALPTPSRVRKLSGRKIAARFPMKLWFDFFSHIISCSIYQNVSFKEGNPVFFHCSGRVGWYHVISCAPGPPFWVHHWPSPPEGWHDVPTRLSSAPIFFTTLLVYWTYLLGKPWSG